MLASPVKRELDRELLDRFGEPVVLRTQQLQLDRLGRRRPTRLGRGERGQRGQSGVLGQRPQPDDHAHGDVPLPSRIGLGELLVGGDLEEQLPLLLRRQLPALAPPAVLYHSVLPDVADKCPGRGTRLKLHAEGGRFTAPVRARSRTSLTVVLRYGRDERLASLIRNSATARAPFPRSRK